MFGIRLREYSAEGVRAGVIDTLSIDFNDTAGDSSTVRFQTSEKIAGTLRAPFIVAVEYSTDGGTWTEAPSGRLIVKEDDGDTTDPAGIVTFVGVNFFGWLLGRNLLHWSASATNGERHWDDRSPGYILNTFLVEAVARGWGKKAGAQFVRWDFTGIADSNGVTWPNDSKIDADHRLLTPASQALSAMTAAGLCEWWTEGLTLRLGVPGTGVDRTAGSRVVRLGPGAKSAPVKTSFDDVFTNLVVVPEKAYYWLYLENSGAPTDFGRLEASQSQDGIESHTVATKLAQPALAAGKTAQREATLSYEAGTATYLPWVHFRRGDVIRARLRGGWESLRVVELLVQKDKDGVVTVSTTLDHRFNALQKKLAQRVSAASVGKTVSGAGAVPLPSAGGPALPPPSAPTGLTLVENAGYVGDDGLPRARVVVSWSEVTQSVDGSIATVDQYEVWVEGGGRTQRLTATRDLQARLELEAGLMVSVTVRAHSTVAGWSEPSTPLIVTPELAYPPEPKAPTGLAVVSNAGSFDAWGRPRSTVTVGWDAVTQGVNDEPITIGWYDVWLAIDGGEPYQVLATKSLTAVLELAPEVPVVVTVRAQAAVGALALGLWSAFSDGLAVTPALVDAPPGTPSAPIAASGLGVVTGTWDGLIDETAPPAGFQYVYAEWSPSDDAEDQWTPFGPQLRQAGTVMLTGQPMGAAVHIRLRAVDSLGRVSDPSPATEVVVVGVTGPDLEANSVTANAISVGAISVQHVEPAFGEELEITANAAIVFAVGMAEDAQAAADGIADDLHEHQQVYRFGVDGAEISSPDSPTSFVMSNEGADIRMNGQPVSTWREGEMWAASFRGDSVVLANHKIERFGTGTVVRRL